MKRLLLAAAAATLLVTCPVAAEMAGVPSGRWEVSHKWSQVDRLPRHHIVKTTGVPEPYASMHNPLADSQAAAGRGAAVYTDNCAACHGAIGEGDGPAGRRLSPQPGDLAWLAETKISLSDGFMYWTIAEGGVPVRSKMPAYKDKLSPDDIWSAITFIRTRLRRQ